MIPFRLLLRLYSHPLELLFFHNNIIYEVVDERIYSS